MSLVLTPAERRALRRATTLLDLDRGRLTALRTRLYTALAASRADVVAGLRRGDVLERVGRDVDAVGDLVVRAYLPMWVAGVVGAATSLGVALVHPPAGAVLAACLLLAGVVGPAATVRAGPGAARARAARRPERGAPRHGGQRPPGTGHGRPGGPGGPPGARP